MIPIQPGDSIRLLSGRRYVATSKPFEHALLASNTGVVLWSEWRFRASIEMTIGVLDLPLQIAAVQEVWRGEQQIWPPVVEQLALL